MDIEAIDKILTLKKYANISKAADYLGISQPALSKSIKQIEESLKFPIFLRLSRGVQLTKEGEIYIKHLEQIKLTLKQAHAEVEKLHSDFTDQVSVSIHPMLGRYIIPKIENKLTEFDEIDLSYKFQTSRKGLDDILNGSVDIAIVTDAKDHPDIVKVKLWQEYLGLYSKDGQEKKTLLFNNDMIHAQRAISKLRAKNIRAINDYGIIHSLLKRNDFMGLLPNPIADNEKKVKLIKKFNIKVDVSIVYKVQKKRTKGFRKVVSIIKEQAKS